MTEISRPWQGVLTGDAGPYSSDQWSALQKAFGNGAADAESGPIMGSGTAPDPGLSVTATSPATATVNVSPGSALVNGTFYDNSAVVNLAVTANASGNPRIDTVVLRKDWTAQTIRLAMLAGTPAATPTAPNLTQTDGVLWETPLADIAVASGFTTLAQSTITPRRNWANAADGVYLNDILNNSGVILQAGDVVIRDATADRAATTTTTVNDPAVMGIWVAKTAVGAYGRVLTKGIGYVNLTAAATRGNQIGVSATTKKADVIAAAPTVSRRYSTIGIALETTSGAGLCLCLINIGVSSVAGATRAIIWDNGASYTTTSNTFVDVDGTNLVITMTIAGSSVLLTFNATIDTGGASECGLDILVDGTRIGAAAAYGIAGGPNGSGNYICGVIVVLVTGLTAGSHTFKPQWRTTSSQTLTMGAGLAGGIKDRLPAFCAMEIG